MGRWTSRVQRRLDTKTSDGEADDVEVATLDTRDVTGGAALDSVGAGFVVWLVGGELGGKFH